MENLLSNLVHILISMLGFEAMPNDGHCLVFTQYINYRVVEDKAEQLLLVVKVYQAKSFLNVWVDNCWESGLPEIGNGFIHKSLYNMTDVFNFCHVVAMALHR